MAAESQKLTEREKDALTLLEQEDHLSRSELMEQLDVRSPDEVSDIMRSLRYKGKVLFSFDSGFQLKEK